MTRAALLRAALLAAVVLVAAGCDRKPRFRSDGDSTAVLSADSLAAVVEQARAGWEGDDRETAADLSARLVVEDLRVHPESPVAARARQFLDSLGFGAEVTGTTSVAAVNFFSAADPSSGSWPWLVWRDAAGPGRQRLEGGSLRLLDLALDERDTGTRRAALLFSRTGGSGQQPLVFVWSRSGKSGNWVLTQSLGPDSLGGSGTARFEGGALVARTWENAAGFTECATCPHVYTTRRFEWDDQGLHGTTVETEPSGYAAFVEFVNALAVGDRDLALSLVEDPSLLDAANAYEWNRSKGQWRVAPGTEPASREMVIFRGNQEAYRVRFTSRSGLWRIEGFDPTSRSIE